MSKQPKAAFKPGDVVILASLCPYMTVAQVYPTSRGETAVDTVWWDGTQFREDTFNAVVLKKIEE